MKPETAQYVSSSAGALKRRGSAGLGVIMEHKPDMTVGRRALLKTLDVKRCTQAQMQTCKYPHIQYNMQKKRWLLRNRMMRLKISLSDRQTACSLNWAVHHTNLSAHSRQSPDITLMITVFHIKLDDHHWVGKKRRKAVLCWAPSHQLDKHWTELIGIPNYNRSCLLKKVTK